MEKTETKQQDTTVATESDGKTIAIIAYITLIGLIIAFVMNNEKKNEFASYHMGQSLGLGLTSLALGMINVIPILGWLISIVGFFVVVYMWVMGLLNALNERKQPVPILGKKYEDWFKNL